MSVAEEVRTRGFSSPSFGGFGFIEKPKQCADQRVMSIADIMTNGLQLRINRLRALCYKQHEVRAWSVRRCFGGVTNKMKGRFGSQAVAQTISPERLLSGG